MPVAPIQGRSIAPPLTADKLATYASAAHGADVPSHLRNAIERLHECVVKYPGGAYHLIPGQSWLASVSEELDKRQADAANRNSEMMEAWRQAVSVALFEKWFPGCDPLEVNARQRLYKKTVYELALLGFEWSRITTALEALFQMSIGKINAERDRLAEWRLAVKEEVKAGRLLPMPRLEPLPVRDGLAHLVWQVKEWNRQPLTS